MHITTTVLLPEAGQDVNTHVIRKMPALATTHIQPVGRWFEALCNRKRHKQTISHHSLRSTSSEDDEEELSEEEEEDEELLRSLDPKDWKNQDHYVVLGLAKLRYKASDEKIKTAYKKKVLKHHPDKRRARGLAVKDGDDDYFTCITRAYETLGNPAKRRSFDSVDPEFDDDIPKEARHGFFKTFGPVFERNSRWSNKKNVPQLGNEDATYEEVNHFYSFWYDFDSWREYSYLDEEEKEKGENREERRWIEKQNKAARQKRKKEETLRIRQLVDNAYACDPRIARFREEEKAKKVAQKEAKREAARQREEEERRKREEADKIQRQIKEQEEQEAKAQAAIVKKEKEAQKKAFKKERKTLRNKLKDFDYFATDDSERVNNMQEVEKLAEYLSLVSLQSLNEDLTSGDNEKAKSSFEARVKEMNEEFEKEKQRHLEAACRQSSGGGDDRSSKSQWTEEEMVFLVKAVNLFPAGTVKRWEVVGNFIQQHISTFNRTPKEVLAKAKELQRMDPANLKQQANEKAYERFEKTFKSAGAAEKSAVSERYDSVAEQQIGETGSNPAPWVAEEQKLLEQALKTFSASTPDRWDRIAEAVPNRSKKDCMRRYKELVEMVKAKKAAQAAVKAKK